MRSLRIAIATDWFAPRRGGIEGQLLHLAEGLGARGHAVDVLTSTPGASSGKGFDVVPLAVTTLPGLQLAVSPTLLVALRRELERGYDIVHAHVSVVSPVGYAAAAIARSLGVPTVVTFHSVLRHKRHLLRAANAVAHLSGSGVVWSGVSDLVADQVSAALDGADALVLPNGIALEFWSEARADVARRRGDSVMLVSTMRLHRKKRPRELLRAFAQATSRAQRNAHLTIVGEGPERSALLRDARNLGLLDGGATVEMPGWLPPDALRPLYAGSDAFVTASMRESFGIAALEARASGLPVIAMRAAGSSEFLRHDENAILCDDDVELVQSMVRLIRDASLRSRLARSTVSLERYDWPAVFAGHEGIYEYAMKRAAAVAGPVAGSV